MKRFADGSTPRAALMIVLAGACLGIGYPAIKVALAHFSPVGVTVARIWFAGLSFVPFMLGRTKSGFGPPLLAILAGLVGFPLFIFLGNIGIELARASTSSIIIGASPVATAMVASALGFDVLSKRQRAGVRLGAVGIVVMFFDPTNQGARIIGLVFLCFALLAKTSHALLQHLALQTNSTRNVLGLGLLAACAATAWWIPETLTSMHDSPVEPLVGLIVVGVIATALAQYFVLEATRMAGPSRASLSLYVVPFVATAGAWGWLGEVPSMGDIMGGATCLAGVALTLGGKPHDADTDEVDAPTAEQYDGPAP